MTREQSIALIESLDTYLDARQERERVRWASVSPARHEATDVAARRSREALIEAMVPIVTGERR
jgi:hypothetical protein